MTCLILVCLIEAVYKLDCDALFIALAIRSIVLVHQLNQGGMQHFIGGLDSYLHENTASRPISKVKKYCLT